MPRYQIFTAANTATLIVNDSTSIVNSAGWVVSVANTSSYVEAKIFVGANSASATNPVPIMPPAVGYLTVSLGSTSIVNTAGWAVNIINTAGWVVNTANHLVDATIETMSMTSSGINVSPYSAVIECSATNNLIVAASASRVFKVLGYTLMAGVANQARFQSGSNSTEFLTGTMFYGASGGMVAPYNPMGWFSVTAGSPLYLKLATANSIGGVISYLVM